MKKTYVLQVHRGTDGQWYVRARSRNGQVVVQTEGYTRHRDAVRAARVLAGTRLVFRP